MPENFTHTVFVHEETIPSVSMDEEIKDYGQLRDEFKIFPGEDGSKYHSLKLLGMGGMGVVYSAEDPSLKRQVAVKLLREPYRQKREQIEKFINEARVTARIDHPNVVSVHQLGVNEHNGVYFSMRRISGETLQNAIRRLRDGDADACRHYTSRRLLDIFISGCNGVAAAHEKKILHCDLKPANIMIGSFGEVLVLDWGLAREFDAPVPADRKPNSISGTPAYMAPELVTGEQTMPDEKTEVYALGTILHCILSWNLSPFDQSLDKDALLEKVAMGKYLPLHPPKGVSRSRELCAICEKAMHRDRAKRYQSVAELLNDLHNYRDGYPVAAYSPNIFYRFFKLCRRHPTIPLTVLAAVITLLIHAAVMRIIDIAHDRSLKRSSLINMDIAENYYNQTIPLFQKKADSTKPDSLLQIAIARKDLEMQALLTMREYFSVLEFISRLSPVGQKEFGRTYGAEIFLRILILNINLGDIQQLQNNLARCERSEIFSIAVANDPRLKKLVTRIKNNTGTIYFNKTDSPWNGNAEIFFADGSSRKLQVNKSGMAELPAGKCWIKFDNNINMHLLIVPGNIVSVTVPDAPASKQFVTIPADHFFMQIPAVGKFLCDLPEFTIAILPDEKPMTHKDAEKLIKKFQKKHPGQWRLPTAAEWYKIQCKDAFGKQGFYGVPENGKEPILLANGEFFSRIIRRTTRIVPEYKGKVYLVKLNDENNAI